MNNKTYTASETDEQYLQAKESVGICREKASLILVSGENSLALLDRCSVKKIDDKIFGSVYTLFFRKKRILSEILILRLSLYRFLVITEEFKPVFKLLKKHRRRYECVVSDLSDEYALFSFHGKKCDMFFNDLDYKYIYKTKQQNYGHYALLCPKKDEDITYNHFVNLNFVPLGEDARKLFLYHHNVVLHIDKIPRRWRLSVCAELYPFDNLKAKTKSVRVVKYELESSQLVTNKHKVYSYSRKKAGVIHCLYRLPGRKYPFIIAFVREEKVRKVSLIKTGKADALIRPIVFY